MLVASKESIARVRGYRSPWLAGALIATVLYFFASSFYFNSVKMNEAHFAEPIVLAPGETSFVSDADSVYLLAKTIDRYGVLRLKQRPKVQPTPSFTLAMHADSESSFPVNLYWFGAPQQFKNSYVDGAIYGACFLQKGQKIFCKTRYLPKIDDDRFEVKLFKMGARVETPSTSDEHLVKCRKFVLAGQTLLEENCEITVIGVRESPGSVLDLPVPLIDTPYDLKIKQNLLPGDRIKSAMLELPKSDAELRQYLAARHIDFSESAPSSR